MVQGVSPVVARRRLRLELRKLREEKEFTQGHVATALEWSLSKVQRIESGDVSVSRTDLVALLTHLGVTAEDKVNNLADLARTARRKVTHWWDEPPYKEALSPATVRLIEFESDATEIRSYQSTLVPGLLQTPEYARLVIDFWHDELTAEQRALRYEARLRRQRAVRERPHPLKYLLLLDESVLLRAWGGPEVAGQQLRFLGTQIERGLLTIRVVPFVSAAPLASVNPFILFTFDDGDSVLYREAHLTDEILESFSMIKRQRRRFERMWEIALSPQESRDLIGQRASAMLSGIWHER